jgi:hypothetical protein
VFSHALLLLGVREYAFARSAGHFFACTCLSLDSNRLEFFKKFLRLAFYFGGGARRHDLGLFFSLFCARRHDLTKIGVAGGE